MVCDSRTRTEYGRSALKIRASSQKPLAEFGFEPPRCIPDWNNIPGNNGMHVNSLEVNTSYDQVSPPLQPHSVPSFQGEPLHFGRFALLEA